MSIVRAIDETANTVTLTYNGEPLAPPLNLNDSRQIVDTLSVLLDNAFDKLRDAGINPIGTAMDTPAVRFLRALYSETDKGRGSADQHEVGAQVGLNLEATDALVAELEENGYVKTMGSVGDLAITRHGIKVFG